jgi:hypothetical protein
MKLLFLGDIVGRPGRDLIRRHVRALSSRHDADLVIANGENAAGGAGITRENMLEILSAGVDVITTGNHVWDKRETLEFIGNEPRLLRPANYLESTPGAGSCVVTAKNGVKVGVINVMGRVFLHAIDDPFRGAEREIARVRGEIERLDADRKNLDRRVTYATVTLTVSEEPKAALDIGPIPVSARYRNAMVDGARAAFESLLEVSLVILRVAPTLAVWVAVLFWPARIVLRRVNGGRQPHAHS